MPRELVVYGRAFGCYDQVRAIAFLERHGVPYRLVNVGKEWGAAERLVEWVGHVTVPTLVVAEPGSDEPFEPPLALDRRQRIRGQDRGTLISEPNDPQLERFLKRHGLL